MSDKCTVQKLPIENLQDAAESPALAALMAEGWTVVASVVVDSGDGRGPHLQLLLAPPPKAANNAPNTVLEGLLRSFGWLIVGVTLGTVGAIAYFGGL